MVYFAVLSVCVTVCDLKLSEFVLKVCPADTDKSA